MASRRMFSHRIINSARFLMMPISCQALYFHLGMNADDDGVVEAYPIIKMVGCTADDLKVLYAKGFVQILNEELVTFITDWNENNKIRADRKIDSIYKDLLIQLNPDVSLIEKRPRADAKPHTGQATDGQRTDNGQPMDSIGKDRLGKDSTGKVSIGKGGAGETRTNTRKSNVDLFTELEHGQLSEVYPSMVRWMTYKDEQKKKYTPTGIKSLITQVRKHVDQYGADAVAECIEVSMSNGYQGIIWDRMKKQSVPQNDDNPFLRMLKESENEQTGNAEDTCSTESGIPEFLPGSSKWW